MTSAYSFVLPTTGTLSLVEFYSSPLYQQSIINADTSRALVRDTLKRAKRDSNPDIVAVLKAIEDYIPYLYNIINGEGIQKTSKPLSVSWRLPLKASAPLIDPPKLELSDIEFERGMILLCYSLALMQLGDSRGRMMEWKQATALFLQAQSVLTHLISNPVNLGETTPYDLQVTTLSSISTMISGSLHLLILYKSMEEEKELASGPATAPMRSIASAALLSRVAMFASEKFGSALQLISTNKKFGEQFQSWLKHARAYSLAACERYVAMEESKRGNVGKAIGILNLALDEIESNKLKNLLKRDKDGLFKLTVELREAISQQISLYSAENKSILFQPIPKPDSIERTWPSGREVVPQKSPWTPSALALDPIGSTGQRGYY